jgi:probable F420-dependent oxidoreductase
MKYDITIFPKDLNAAADIAKEVEEYGFDGLWTAEVAHNPFLPLALGASVTKRINLGTQIAVAFPRSPMVTAQIAWDLAAYSKGRFILGLGTQVKAHITKRFSAEWGSPVEKMSEYIESMRAIWHTFQTGTPLRYKREYYTFTLMTPFFNPGSIENPDIPVYIAGVNEKICELAGEICQGIHAHAFHTRRYLQEVVLGSVEVGIKQSGRSRSEFEVVVPIFVITGRTQSEIEQKIAATKAHIAFYASTPTYAAVLDLHGWNDIGERLSQMAREGNWNEMWTQISDEMLHEVAVVGMADEIGAKIKERYQGVADRICFGWDTENPDSRTLWKEVAKAIV